MSSGVSNDLAQTSEALLAHSFSVDYNMEDPKVFVGDRYMQEQQEEDAMMKGIVVDSTKVGRECVHKEM
jgi:hypothetical protein